MAKGAKRDLKQSDEAIDSLLLSPDAKPSPPSKRCKASLAAVAAVSDDDEARFVGKPIPADQAREKWPHRYESKKTVKVIASSDGEMEREIVQAKCHYTKAIVDGIAFDLFDDAYVKAEEGHPDFIARIVEMFETVDKQLYFSAQWFFRAEDTVIKSQAHLIDKRRVFYSEMKDDNPLDSIVSKVKIIQLPPNVDLAEKEKALSSYDLYYDMQYSKPVTFTTLHKAGGHAITESGGSSVISDDVSSNGVVESGNKNAKSTKVDDNGKSEMTLLDLYSGCGAMSTGLCYGTNMAGVKLVTKWAVDIDQHACESLKLNHAETQVRNEAAEDFLSLLKEWEKLCKEFNLLGSKHDDNTSVKPEESDSEEIDENRDPYKGEFEVQRLLAVCYGDPNKANKQKLHFKVRWKGFGPSYDTWEPMDGLSNCTESIKDFVTRGYRSRILPLPNLPQFPLPTHEVVGRGVVPVEFKDCIVGSDDDDKSHKLEKSILLGDAISDLPEVTNNNGKDEMEYAGGPRTNYQKYIRLRKQALGKDSSKRMMLYDHRPLELNEDDYARVCHIPKIKGANFRDLPGVKVGKNNKVEWDPSVERVMLPSGKPLVPNYAMTFVRGTSKKPFGRLGMDDIVTTVVGRAEPHNQVLLHPNQDRVLTIRENARLQGFPDHYKLCGPVKARYMQIGNAVSFSVSTGLGYTLAKAIEGVCTSKPLKLPVKFPDCLGQLSSLKQDIQDSL